MHPSLPIALIFVMALASLASPAAAQGPGPERRNDNAAARAEVASVAAAAEPTAEAADEFDGGDVGAALGGGALGLAVGAIGGGLVGMGIASAATTCSGSWSGACETFSLLAGAVYGGAIGAWIAYPFLLYALGGGDEIDLGYAWLGHTVSSLVGGALALTGALVSQDAPAAVPVLAIVGTAVGLSGAPMGWALSRTLRTPRIAPPPVTIAVAPSLDGQGASLAIGGTF